ncbi:MAG TPA: peptide chain release factor N(5)-glutamine methyltransferase [Holophagaceae bacterium]|jgi:release factor glutamine methyltransferase|nr:peptide chain release factor N(5)-glutamine methyltransferase [Holophagaceae bacterium]
MTTWRRLRESLIESLATFLDAEEGRAEAALWLEEGLGKSRSWIAANGAERAPFAVKAQVAAWLKRREAGEPWQLILGWTPFRGRRFQVTRDTLIPRPETELAVEEALKLGRTLEAARVVDIGTGSGIIAISLALESLWPVSAVELGPAALAVAKENAESLGARVTFFEGSLLDPLPDAFFADGRALVVANLPYVDPADAPGLQRELDFEPASALFAADRGLALNKQLLRDARAREACGIVLELGAGQGEELAAFAVACGWQAARIVKDWHGHDRVLVAEAS